MSANEEREHSGNYDAAFKNLEAKLESKVDHLEAKVDLLIGELIKGNKDLGRPGHVKKTEVRLSTLEKRMDAQLAPDHVKIITKAVDLFGSYRFIFGMLATSILALAGISSIAVQLLRIFKGG